MMSLLPQKPISASELDPTHTKTIGSYVLGKTLGKGTFGKVKQATHIQTGELVAIKILQKEKIIDVSDVERISREIHILKLIRHPSIVQLYEIIQTSKQLFLVMEYLQNGQLFDYIVKNKKIEQKEACQIFQQIIGGIEYIHKMNIVHRDLKPENLMIDYDNSIRILDFGLSNTYRKQQRLKTACGSPCYAAPEMIEGKNKYEPILVDIWSCGVILYAMLCGCLPFQDPETSKLYQKILAGDYKIPKHLSADAKDILSKILNTKPEERYRIEDIRQHKWWQLSSSQKERYFNYGIIVGYHRIPVDETVLQVVEKLGFQKQFTRKCIQANRHNEATTSYYLLLKKYVKNGGISKAYLGSKNFDPSLIQPLRKKVSNSFSIQHHAVMTDENRYNSQILNEKGQNSKQRFSRSQPKITKGLGLKFSNKQCQTQHKNSQVYENSNRAFHSHDHHTRKNRDQFEDYFKYKKRESNEKNYRNLINVTHKLSSKTKEVSQQISKSSKDKQKERRIFDDEFKVSHKVRSNSREGRSYYIGNSKGNDLISKKYRQTYGASLISRQKSQEKNRRRSMKRSQLEMSEKSNTIDIYNLNTNINLNSNAKSGRSRKIGFDKGFQNHLATLDSNKTGAKAYINRRALHY